MNKSFAGQSASETGLPGTVVKATTSLIFRGLEVNVIFEARIDQLALALYELVSQPGFGYEHAKACGSSETARAICPIHHARLSPRDKQGDRWLSHRHVNSEGREVWCDGTFSWENVDAIT